MPVSFSILLSYLLLFLSSNLAKGLPVLLVYKNRDTNKTFSYSSVFLHTYIHTYTAFPNKNGRTEVTSAFTKTLFSPTLRG